MVLEPLVAILDSAVLHELSPRPVTRQCTQDVSRRTWNSIRRLYFRLVPQTFEQLHVGTGFVLYETIVNVMTSDPALLKVSEVRDRAYVFVDQVLLNMLSSIAWLDQCNCCNFCVAENCWYFIKNRKHHIVAHICFKRLTAPNSCWKSRASCMGREYWRKQGDSSDRWHARYINK